MKNFVPDDFIVPLKLERQEFILRPLTVNDVVKDYDAVMTSLEHLKGIFGPKSSWPQPGLTLEQDLIDLGWHQKEFQTRRSFAYTVVNPHETEVLGCVYLLPTQKRGYDAEVYLWARQRELASGLEDRLFAATRAWLAAHWPFQAVAYPGRDLSLAAWQALPDEAK